MFFLQIQTIFANGVPCEWYMNLDECTPFFRNNVPVVTGLWRVLILDRISIIKFRHSCRWRQLCVIYEFRRMYSVSYRNSVPVVIRLCRVPILDRISFLTFRHFANGVMWAWYMNLEEYTPFLRNTVPIVTGFWRALILDRISIFRFRNFANGVT
jgi:hypothetical protein